MRNSLVSYACFLMIGVVGSVVASSPEEEDMRTIMRRAYAGSVPQRLIPAGNVAASSHDQGASSTETPTIQPQSQTSQSVSHEEHQRSDVADQPVWLSDMNARGRAGIGRHFGSSVSDASSSSSESSSSSSDAAILPQSQKQVTRQLSTLQPPQQEGERAEEAPLATSSSVGGGRFGRLLAGDIIDCMQDLYMASVMNDDTRLADVQGIDMYGKLATLISKIGGTPANYQIFAGNIRSGLDILNAKDIANLKGLTIEYVLMSDEEHGFVQHQQITPRERILYAAIVIAEVLEKGTIGGYSIMEDDDGRMRPLGWSLETVDQLAGLLGHLIDLNAI